MIDPAGADQPETLFGTFGVTKNINGNQLLQVPEGKFNGWVSHATPLDSGATLMFMSSYSWIDEVYYSPFENEIEKAEAYGRLGSSSLLDIRRWPNGGIRFREQRP